MGARSSEGPPWTPAEFAELLDLLRRIAFDSPTFNVGTQRVSGFVRLLSSGSSVSLRDLLNPKSIDIAPDWKILKKNSLYRRLQSDKRFVLMQESFRKLEKRRGVRWSPRVEFRFLSTAILAAQQYFCDKRERAESGLGRGVYANDRVAAREAIKILKRILKKRIDFEDPLDSYRLSDLLGKLDSTLSKVEKKRRETDETPATNAIRLLARYLTAEVNVPVRSVLQEFAIWLGAQTNPTTIAEISADAMRKNS